MTNVLAAERAAPHESRARREAPARQRLASVDLLRGLVMVVMTLDHVRDFLHSGALNPRDVTYTTLFLTRWITHFCAPTFVFLAGVAAFLHARRLQATSELSAFLLTRGLWLVVLEVTVVRFGWFFSFDFPVVSALVLWALGWSMVVLAALVHLPRAAVAAFGFFLIAGHNALDGVRAAHLGALAPLWIVLHEVGRVQVTADTTLFVGYPLVPWIGVMALGHACGPWLLLDERARRRRLWGAGLSACVAFVVLRALNGYGDPARWTTQHDAIATVLSFLDCEKYPPSLSFLLMTLGPAVAALPLLERARGPVADALAAVGRVPLAYYVVHLFVIHAIAVAMSEVFFGDGSWLVRGSSFVDKPRGYGFGLPVIYAVWVLVVLALLPLCRWYAGVKRRRDAWWLSYV